MQEQGAEPEGLGLSLNVLLAKALASLEEKRVDFPSLIAVLSLFNLFSILNNAAQSQGLLPKAASPGAGLGDLAGLLTGMLGGGGAPGPDMLSGLMQKQGKGINPQMLLALMSLLNEAKTSSPPPANIVESSQPAPQEKRSGRGFM